MATTTDFRFVSSTRCFIEPEGSEFQLVEAQKSPDGDNETQNNGMLIFQQPVFKPGWPERNWLRLFIRPDRPWLFFPGGLFPVF